MTTDEVMKGLLGEISAITGREESALSVEKPLSLNGIDSMGFVELLLSVKRLYGVNLVDAGLRGADVKSVRSLAEKICELGK